MSAVTIPTGEYARAVGLTAFEGIWELDTARSESLNAHLAALGLSELARIACEKLKIRMTIESGPSYISFKNTTQLGEKVRHLRVESEYVEEGRKDSEVRMRLTAISPLQIQLSTVFRLGSIIDVRTIEESGEVLHQITELTTKAGDVVTTNRYYRRLRAVPTMSKNGSPHLVTAAAQSTTMPHGHAHGQGQSHSRIAAQARSHQPGQVRNYSAAYTGTRGASYASLNYNAFRR